jgi:hypothetical protein
VPPNGIEVSSRMFGENLILTFPRIDHPLHTIANGRDHVRKCFDTRASRHLAVRGHDPELAVGPAVECFEESIQCATLPGVDCRVAIAWKYLTKIDEVDERRE